MTAEQHALLVQAVDALAAGCSGGCRLARLADYAAAAEQRRHERDMRANEPVIVAFPARRAAAWSDHVHGDGGAA